MNKHERLLYQANAVPSMFAMLFLVFNTWQTIFTLNGVDASAVGIRIAEIILLNILLSFMAFITSFEIKHYSLTWSRAGLCLGIFQCLRVFMISSTISGSVRINITASLFISGIIVIVSSVFSIGMCKKYILAKKES